MRTRVLLLCMAALLAGACNPKGDEGPPNDPKPNGPISRPSPPPDAPAAPVPTAAPKQDAAALVDDLEREVAADDAAED